MNKKAARRIVLLCTLVLVLSGCKTGRSGSQNPDESASAEKFSQPVLSVPDPASILLSGQETSPKVCLSYEFSGDDAAKAGYAEGLLSLSSSETAPHTGDLLIFMSFDGGFHPEQRDIFTDSQLAWVENLLLENYGKGKNIYLIQHALIRQYGAGDDPETPYYHGSLNPETESVRKFISLLEEYKDIIWISGHSHETFALGYNYSNRSGTSCNMIHNPSIANPTHVTDGAIDYTPDENLSQGYYVQVFESAIIFSGANICDQKIYPAYSYIIDGRTSPSAREPEADVLDTDISVTDDALRSVLANVNTVLGIYYEFSSYDQYQTLKKYYYQYKDADTAAMSREELLTAYSRLRLSIASLHQILEFINGSG